ncbi:integrase [Pseudomonas cichorii]|nr:integrase [Pseudomonas cichorii]MBX8474094.1 integrase [Pseudomonas cichorii]GFM49024.1 integrase [Pseudomonas cichorii]
MRNRKKENRDLPERMLRRSRKRKNGKLWVAYYYCGRNSEGKRIEIPLGQDLAEAKIEWARLERKALPKLMRLMRELFDRYESEIIPGKAPRTQRDNKYELQMLRKAFDEAPIESITPPIVAQYRDARTAKTRANREIALLSHVFTIAVEWGFANKNPCLNVRRNKEKARDFYATEAIWKAVYEEAAQELRDAMDLAYLAAQRPADTLKMALSDLTEEFLLVGQNKTDKRLRIRLSIDGKPTQLGLFISDLLERRTLAGIKNSRLITNQSGLRMSWEMLRNRFNEARSKASEKLKMAGDFELAEHVSKFQFKDIRPKAASDIDDIGHASKLLGHSKEKITKDVYRRVGEIVSPTR